MKKSLITLSLFAIASITISCNEAKEETVIEEVKEVIKTDGLAADNAHNSMNSLDWEGTYTGTLPCASCEGIETELVLNYDNTYKLVRNYLGGNDALEEEESGTFTWTEDGSTVILNNKSDSANHYKVGEGMIWLLDSDGNQVSGELADHYILKKK